MSEPIERELKFRVDSLDRQRDELIAAGAEQHVAPSFEDNRVWDRRGELRERGCVLRLRRDGRGERLTFKGPARFTEGVKERVEHELSIASADTMAAILESLGFAVSRRYQKVREEWLFDDTIVTLDRTPMGDFVEIEGTAALRSASRLGLDPATAESASYLELWEQHRHGRPDLPADMVFDPLPAEAGGMPETDVP